MPAIAYQYPPEIAALREAITGFIRTEVIPRHEKHRAMFEDPHKAYDERGLYSAAHRALIDEVRAASAAPPRPPRPADPPRARRAPTRPHP